MKKFIILPLLCLSTSMFAGRYNNDSYKTENKWMDFKAIWCEISNEEYGLALYHLKDIDIDSAETELQVQMFQLIIAMKTKDRSTEKNLIDDVDDDC